jgi:diphthamide biosynthesis methyltransferase
MIELLQQLQLSAREVSSPTTVPNVCQVQNGKLTELTAGCFIQAGDHNQLAVYAAQVGFESCVFIVSSLQSICVGALWLHLHEWLQDRLCKY